MTISEALAAFDALRPNMYTEAEKIAWLSECDGLIWNDVLLMRQRPAAAVPPWPNPLEEDENYHPFPLVPEEPDESPWSGQYDEYYAFDGYTSSTKTVDGETVPVELLVPFPYDRDVYIYYLMMMADQANGEIEKYNQSSKLYNNALLTYRNFVNRQRTPARTGATARFWW